MLKIFATASALALLALPAMAQTGTSTQSPPSAQNSGTGITGAPGSKNGPALNQSGTTGTGSGESDHNKATQQRDSAKVPGMKGGKSGPAERSPNSSAK